MKKQIVMAAGACLIASASANAVTIYAMNNLAGGGGAGTQNTLISFDSANPAGWTTIGPSGVTNAGFSGLDFAGFNGGLYGYTAFAPAGQTTTPGLYSVNPNTGASTVVGNLSGQVLQDLAWNPVTGQMFGVNNNILYTVNLNTGAVSQFAVMNGVPPADLEVGLAIDAAGTFYVHDISNDTIYSGTPALMTPLYGPAQVGATNFSQGMVIDWSGDGMGYHGAIGNATGGGFFSELRQFTTNGSSYSIVGNFGTTPPTFPTVETGDVAINPIPAPGALALLGLAGLAGARRRRN
jgi:hypothetical protein